MFLSNAPTSPSSPSPVTTMEIGLLLPGDDASAFRTLNEEWIARYFALEARAIETLSDPETTILDKGGSILMLYADNQPVAASLSSPWGKASMSSRRWPLRHDFEVAALAVTSSLKLSHRRAC